MAAKPRRPPGVVQALGGVGVAQEDGVVEIEDQPSHAPPQQRQFPARQQPPLQDDGIGSAQVDTHAQPAPQAARQRVQVEAVSGLFQVAAKGGQPIAAADMIGGVHQSDKIHPSVLRDRGKGRCLSEPPDLSRRPGPRGKPPPCGFRLRELNPFNVSAAKSRGESPSAHRPSCWPRACRAIACLDKRPTRPSPAPP